MLVSLDVFTFQYVFSYLKLSCCLSAQDKFIVDCVQLVFPFGREDTLNLIVISQLVNWSSKQSDRICFSQTIEKQQFFSYISSRSQGDQETVFWT